MNKNQSQRRSAIAVKAIWWGVGGFFALVALLFVLIYNGVIGYMPPVEDLKNPIEKFASTIYTADGKEMGKFYRSKGNRSNVEYNQMSDYLKDALIATEDVRFEQHSGIDARAIGRSLVKRVIMGQKGAGGGSTITQQLAKQLYAPESANIFERALQKPIEWVIAVKLERYYTKEEIIKMYFNQFDFLNNAVGIKTAAFVYFGKDPSELNLQESAMLVGMCKNPSYYNPLRYPERVKERRNVVIDQMYKAGMITGEQSDALKKTELDLHPNRVGSHEGGIAPYFREELRRIMMAPEPKREKYSNVNAYNADKYNWDNNPLYGWCKKNKKPDGSYYDIYNDGLRIYTTIDSRMQEYAEAAVRQHMIDAQGRFFKHECGGSYRNPYTRNREELSAKGREALIQRGIRNTDRYRSMKAEGMSEQEILSAFNQKIEMRLFDYQKGEVERLMSPLDSMLYMKTFLRCGMMSMDPRTGKVKAYVGGPDFKHFKYDMVSTGTRQIGSTMKPFVFALAMQNGLTPCSTDFENSQPNYGGWSPRGGSHGLGRHPQLRDALAQSSNWIPPRILERYTPQQMVTSMHDDFGITSELVPNLTLSLGSCEVSLYEMISAYSAFANYGRRVLPVMVSRICDNNGNVIAEFYSKQNQAISMESGYRMIDMLRAVVDRGTGRRLSSYNLKADLCGKTGTTNYNADAWFIGFTPELITGVWFGGEERYIHFQSTGEGQGAAAALPIFGLFMQKVFGDSSLPYNPDTKFNIPSDFAMCGEKIWDNFGGQVVEHTGHDEQAAEPTHAQQDQEIMNSMME